VESLFFGEKRGNKSSSWVFGTHLVEKKKKIVNGGSFNGKSPEKSSSEGEEESVWLPKKGLSLPKRGSVFYTLQGEKKALWSLTSLWESIMSCWGKGKAAYNGKLG